MKTRFLKPAADPKRPGEVLTVLDPFTLQPLPAEGAEVEYKAYWIRRMNDGDVVEATPVKATKKGGTAKATVEKEDNQ